MINSLNYIDTHSFKSGRSYCLRIIALYIVLLNHMQAATPAKPVIRVTPNAKKANHSVYSAISLLDMCDSALDSNQLMLKRKM